MSDKRIDWDDLRYVLAIARSGGLGAAARSLGVNHSSVYRRLANLEARLGVSLFERQRTGYHLTSRGEMLVDAARRVEVEILSAQTKVLGADLKFSGTVRVSTSELLGFYLLPPLLCEFSVRYPDIEIELSVNNTLADLTRRDADVVVRATDKPPEFLVGRRISKMASSAYARHDYLQRIGRDRSLQDYEWLGFDETLEHVPQARWLHNHVPRARIRFRFDLIEALHQCACAGLGVAVLPCFVGDRDPVLERLTPPEMFGEFGVWVLTHPDLRRSARIRAFMQEIGTMIAAKESLLLGISSGRP
jgi:DNA-binding transcriptional LysR family regulator